MTKLTYIVNGEEFTSYSQAVARSRELRVPLTRRYTPIPEDYGEVDPEIRAKRVAAIRAGKM